MTSDLPFIDVLSESVTLEQLKLLRRIQLRISNAVVGARGDVQAVYNPAWSDIQQLLTITPNGEVFGYQPFVTL